MGRLVDYRCSAGGTAEIIPDAPQPPRAARRNTDAAQEERRQAPLPQPRLRNAFAETVHDAAHGAAAPVIQNYDNVEGCCIVI